MEAYSSSYSSSKSSYLSHNSASSSLHSVRKTPAKSWTKKAPVAPMPPTPARVYNVDPINFRDLVQQLTCAPEFMPRHQSIEGTATAATSLDDVPSPPIQNQSSRDSTAGESSSASLLPVGINNGYHYFQPEYFGMNSQDGVMNLSSPSASNYGNNWFFFPPMSPRT